MSNAVPQLCQNGNGVMLTTELLLGLPSHPVPDSFGVPVWLLTMSQSNALLLVKKCVKYRSACMCV